ncbi:Signal transduction histidine kinase [Malonomonas rubra DSM 5091]|uniref:histidine kinase n=1 Tax=Malonomonas rubra DSM 5091 TaxID=1122189 RepID=A0A1M6BS71_MALRU|nr:ATP-binding protein [Malonomonas rubra]SHI51582.1 Signal transduction histidine kinase [Malonomonas rubra DSM 5091]
MSKSSRNQLAIILILVLAITALHYLTSTSMHSYHGIYRRLYYIPIILGGLWFMLRGGIIVALFVSAIYLPHVLFQWGHHPTTGIEQYLEILLYNIIGLLTGALASREQKQKKQLEKTTNRLEESYAKLKSQADQLLETEEQLRRADRLSALGELSAGMAHEIRNPLGSIRGTAEILKEGMDKNDKRLEFAEILVKEVNRLDGVVRDFLNFARPADSEQKTVEICDALQEVATLTRQQAVKAKVEVSLYNDDQPKKVFGSLEQYKQAFLNLVLNALQAMPDGGTLGISCTRGQDKAIISFTDTGPGIPEDLQDRIFNPFYTTRSDGTGLGLAISHRIIDAHGGKLKVSSKPGAGACFSIELPIANGAHS